MYCTGQVSKPHQGVFALFRVVGFDSDRDSDCKRYGSSSGYGATAFTKLALVQRVTPSLSSKAMRADPLLGAMQCVRRSFQGTFFALDARELKRLVRLADAVQAQA